MWRSAVAVVAAAVSLSGLTMGTAASASPRTGSVTGGNDPFASCGAGGDGFGGVNFPQTNPEVWLANNPADPQNLIGAVQQDRWSDGGAKGLVSPVSSDNGRTWTDVPLPFSVCAAPYYKGHVLANPFGGGSTGIPAFYDRASDPWVSVGPDGKAYNISLSFDANDNSSAVGAATSTDGGRSWKKLRTIIADDPNDPTQPFNDKESITADPKRAGVAYAVWDRLQLISCGGVAKPTHAPIQDDHAFAANVGKDLACYDGPGMFSMTSDGGRTWSTPRAIVTNAPNEQTIGNEVVVGPDGTIYDFYMYAHADNSLSVESVASHDGGATFGARRAVAVVQPVGVTDPKSGAPLRTGDVIPQPAVDPRTGQLYAVWQDSRANQMTNQEDGLYISTSLDGGASWSSPVPVGTPSDGAAFTPAVKVGPHGNVIVQYYALRRAQTQAGVLPTDTVLRSTRGPGLAFTAEEPIASFNMLAAPFAGGYFTGDYEGLALDLAQQNKVHTFYTATNCQDTGCDAVSGFDAAGNPIPTDHPDPTDVFSAALAGR